MELLKQKFTLSSENQVFSSWIKSPQARILDEPVLVHMKLLITTQLGERGTVPPLACALAIMSVR